MKNLTLRELSEEALALDDLVAMDGGEWTDEVAALHDELMPKLLAKTDHYASYVKELEGRESVMSEEIARLTARKRTLTARIAWMKRYAAEALTAMGRPKVEGALFTLAVQKNSTPELLLSVMTDALPPAFVKVIPETREPDRQAIVAALKSGTVIEGAELSYGHHLRIR